MDDAEVEAYLNGVSDYADKKTAAGNAWKEAFIQLARARIADRFSLAHDPLAGAALQVRNNKVSADAKAQREVLALVGGAWAPPALVAAQLAFEQALRCELEADASKQ